MEKQLVHVVFGDSPGGVLRQALKQAGLAERVLPHPDNLAFGPIDDCDHGTRRKWVKRNLSCAGSDPYYCPTRVDMNLFWNQFHGAANNKVIWFSRRSSKEYCGFLECLRRADKEETLLVNDLTKETIQFLKDGKQKEEPCPPTTHLNVESMMELLGGWVALPQAHKEKYREEWGLLRRENAAFRVLEDGNLVSAPITYFDDYILSEATNQWRKAAMIVALAMSHDWEASVYNDIGDLPLFSRLNHLIDTGALAGRGDRTHMGRLEVRTPF
jgi:hypothetical protein